MKRRQDDTGADASKVKRAKAMQACSNCRKSKTRCEIIDGTRAGMNAQRCHRCTVLKMQCSFEVQMAMYPADEHPMARNVPPSSSSLVLCNVPANMPTDDAALSPPNAADDDDLVHGLSAPWAFADNSHHHPDWTNTPMLVVRELGAKHTKPYQVPPDLQLPADTSLEEILTVDQVTRLLGIFETNYAPWMHIPPQATRTPLLDLAQCTVASRHMEYRTRAFLAPRLEALTEKTLLQQIFMPSVDLIRVVTILSLWPPICVGPTAAATRDTRLLIASGVNLAISLTLAQASNRACTLKEKIRESPGEPSVAISRELAEAGSDARTWIALSNVESSLCIGTGRKSISVRSQFDYNFIAVTPAMYIAARRKIPPGADYDLSKFSKDSPLARARDVRLGIIAELYRIVEAGTELKLTAVNEFDKFRGDVETVLHQFSSMLQIIHTIHHIAKHETFHFRMLLLEYHNCQLLFVFHALRQARVVLRPHFSTKLWPHATHNGQVLFAAWTKLMVLSCEQIMSCILSAPSPELSTAPDIIFTMVAHAVMTLVVIKFSIWDMSKLYLAGFGDDLPVLVVDKLKDTALSDDHAAIRCARVVRALSDSWQSQMRRHAEDRQADGCNGVKSGNSQTHVASNDNVRVPSSRHDVQYPSPNSTTHSTPHNPQGSQPHAPLEYPTHFGNGGLGGDAAGNLDDNTFAAFVNQETLYGSDFWSTFMQNLATESPPSQHSHEVESTTYL